MSKITLPHSVVNYCHSLCRQAFRNQNHIRYSTNCVCYHCREYFNKKEITEWCDDDGKGPLTALCPRCGIDSVLSDSQIPIGNRPLVRLASLVLFGGQEVSSEDMYFEDPDTGEKVSFKVIDRGDSFGIEIMG